MTIPSDAEPKLSAGTVHDTLKAICAENDRTLDDLAPSVFTTALTALSSIAEAVIKDSVPSVSRKITPIETLNRGVE
jgi:hypothetical protein